MLPCCLFETKLTQNCVLSANVRCVLPVRAASTGPKRAKYGQGTGQPVQGPYGIAPSRGPYGQSIAKAVPVRCPYLLVRALTMPVQACLLGTHTHTHAHTRTHAQTDRHTHTHTHTHTNSEHRFPAPSSKLCQERFGYTDKTVEAT